MANNVDINNELDWTQELQMLISTYEEIAAMRMRKSRSAVLQSRKFTKGLVEVFHELKNSYKKDLEKLMKKRKESERDKLSAIQRNGKTVAVLLAANTALYGDIVSKTFSLFSSYVDKNPCDSVVIGRLGSRMFQEVYKDKPFTYYDFPDSGLDLPKLSKIIQDLVVYEKILIFYAEFENLASQQPVMLDLYGQETNDENKEVSAARYFFEPSLEEILIFFETQIYSSFFEQSVSESQLAKYAARMATLDNASENIKKDLKKLLLAEKLLKHRTQSKKQLNTLAGMSLWTK